MFLVPYERRNIVGLSLNIELSPNIGAIQPYNA